ncbi:MAG: DNA repair protein RadC [Clostridiaceae bacterium]
MNDSLKLMDLPINERPRERLAKYGPDNLSNSELLAIILRVGSSKENVLNLSSRILVDSGGLNGLINMKFKDFMKVNGVGEAKASQIVALAELSKRIKSYKSGDLYKISSPDSAAELVMEEMRNLKKEYLKIILLNTKNIVIKIEDISIGSLNSSIVHPREVFTVAVEYSSASIIICHNHPSGDPSPSSEDINITKRLVECGKLLGIAVLDHIIIGNGKFISLKEKGII